MTETVKDTRNVALEKVQEEFSDILQEMKSEVGALPKTDEEKSKAQILAELIGSLENTVNSIGKPFTDDPRLKSSFQKISFYELFGNEGDIGSLKADDKGNFGKVWFRDFRGQKVAVKIQNPSDEEEDEKKKRLSMKFEDEISTLRVITHENIISFRGWGEHQGISYLVMEHLDKNLQNYVIEQNSDENKGLSSRITWAIAKQIAQAMLYLHSLESPIYHGDLKADNILVDTKPIIPKPKICDFGFALQDFTEDRPLAPIRYRAKKQELEEVKSMKDLFKVDVYGYGLIVLFMRSGQSPYIGYDTLELNLRGLGESNPLIKKDGNYYVRRVKLPPDLPGKDLGKLIKKCCRKADERPTFKEIEEEFFGKRVENPFNLSEKDFFECGFLKDTQIYVAESLIDDTKDGKYKPSEKPPGYRSKDLICSVEVKNKPYHDKPTNEKQLELYKKHYGDFREKAELKLIDDNPAVALAALVTRKLDDGTQKLELRFKWKTYCHHRAMREIWRSFESQEKENIVPDLKVVHRLFSTSFGLHVAILTNEGPGKPKKFVFTRRSNKPGMATPGSYTCGAVESCSIKDFVRSDQQYLVNSPDPDLEYIFLLNTAARGLEEELGLPLRGSDKEAITLNTIYLKYDMHEWGMCGFVDLTSEKIRKENQFSFEKLNAAFTAGPKDKFEHWQIYGVDFELRNMVEWIRKNHDKLASSAKIAVVKVLQAFFGIDAVETEFAKKM